METEYDRFGADSFLHLVESPSPDEPEVEICNVRETAERVSYTEVVHTPHGDLSGEYFIAHDAPISIAAPRVKSPEADYKKILSLLQNPDTKDIFGINRAYDEIGDRAHVGFWVPSPCEWWDSLRTTYNMVMDLNDYPELMKKIFAAYTEYTVTLVNHVLSNTSLDSVGIGGNVDLAEVKREFGDRISLRGNVNSIEVMLRGTPDDDGRFRMWYTGWEIPGHGPVPLEKNWDHYVHVCYAESDNGIDWQRVNLGLVEYGGNRNNNLVPNLWLRPVIMRDDLEPDPERRYKCWEQTWPSVSLPGRGQIHTSPDGIRWKTEDSPRAFPGTRPHWFGWDSILRDEEDPERRWKAYGYFSTAGTRRTAGHAFSADGIRWTGDPENPIIDPLQGVQTTCHDFVVWRERGLYIGLLQVGDTTVRDYDFELVVSRDGIHFSRVADGRSFLRRGAEGDWDPGSICVYHNGPVFVRDQAWFYYGAKASSSQKKFEVKELMATWHGTPTSGGLAVMQKGRYAGFSPTPGCAAGTLCTVPAQVPPRTELGLRINARCAEGGQVQVSLLDAETHREIAGYSMDECEPITSDHISIAVRWNGRTKVSVSRPAVRLNFQLKGAATIYGFEWTDLP